MNTHESKLYWAIQKRRDPKLIAATLRLKQIGARLDLELGMTEQALMDHAIRDASEALCILPQKLNPESMQHVDVMSAVITAFFEDLLDSDPRVDRSKSHSSYGQ